MPCTRFLIGLFISIFATGTLGCTAPSPGNETAAVVVGSQPVWSNDGSGADALLVTLRSSRAHLVEGEDALLKASANNRSGKPLSVNMVMQLGNGLIITSTNSCSGDPCTGHFELQDGIQGLMSMQVRSGGPVADSYSVVLHYDYTDPEGNKVRGKVEGLLGSSTYIASSQTNEGGLRLQGSPADQTNSGSSSGANPPGPTPTPTPTPTTIPTYTPMRTYTSFPTVTPKPGQTSRPTPAVKVIVVNPTATLPPSPLLRPGSNYVLTVREGQNFSEKTITFRIGSNRTTETSGWAKGKAVGMNLTAFSGQSIHPPGIKENMWTTGDCCPQLFYGTAYLDGKPAPKGTIISAWIDGSLVGETMVADIRAANWNNSTAAMFQGLGDNLMAVWHQNESTRAWEFYVPWWGNDVFLDVTTYLDASSGDVVFVNVLSEIPFQEGHLFPGWNLITLNP